jgi:hypothetical protein
LELDVEANAAATGAKPEVFILLPCWVPNGMAAQSLELTVGASPQVRYQAAQGAMTLNGLRDLPARRLVPRTARFRGAPVPQGSERRAREDQDNAPFGEVD